MSKQPIQVIHCGTVVTLKDGKGKCPRCNKPLMVKFDVGQTPKPSHKKRGYQHSLDARDWWILPALIIVSVIAYGMYMSGYLWVIVVCAMLYLVLRLLFGKKGRRA